MLRNRGLFVGAVVLLIGLWFLKAAFSLAGMAFKFIVIAVVLLVAIGWMTTKAGRGR